MVCITSVLKTSEIPPPPRPPWELMLKWASFGVQVFIGLMLVLAVLAIAISTYDFAYNYGAFLKAGGWKPVYGAIVITIVSCTYFIVAHRSRKQ